MTTPAYMARIPDGPLFTGGKRLLNWLESVGLPRPSLLHLEMERKFRKDNNPKPVNNRRRGRR